MHVNKDNTSDIFGEENPFDAGDEQSHADWKIGKVLSVYAVLSSNKCILFFCNHCTLASHEYRSYCHGLSGRKCGTSSLEKQTILRTLYSKIKTVNFNWVTERSEELCQ